MNDASEICSQLPSPAPARLGALLIKHGVISQQQMDAATALQVGEQSNFIKALFDLGFIQEAALVSFLVKQLKIPHLNLMDYKIDRETLKVLPRELCLHYRLLPIDLLGKNLTLAMVNPLDEAAFTAVQAICPEFRLKTFLCTLSEFQSVSRRLFEQDGPDEKNAGSMSLEALGLSAAPRRPSAAPATSKEHDPTATMVVSEAEAQPVERSQPLRASLICLDGWEPGRAIEIAAETCTLGRSPDADITVDSPRVSREHARITRNGSDAFALTDLNSTNGTFVNNVRITTTILRHGDRVLLDNVLFRFVLLEEMAAQFGEAAPGIDRATGLLPADVWTEELERVLEMGVDWPLSTALIEFDHLPALVEAHGSAANAVVQADFSDILGRYLARGDRAGNLNGRIAVAFSGKSLESVFSKMEDLRRTVEAHAFQYRDDRFRTTISIGLAATDRAVPTGEFLERLDRALRNAITQGRNATAVPE